MHIELLISVLGWCAVVNFGFLLFWAGFMVFATDLTIRLQQTFFDIDKATIFRYNYLLMGFFKLLTLMFFVVPWCVLHVLA